MIITDKEWYHAKILRDLMTNQGWPKAICSKMKFALGNLLTYSVSMAISDP